MAHIEVEKLCKTINKSIVLEDINLDMSSGKVYGFQGINGSGKTMLMRALIGLIHPTSGRVCIDGKELGKDIMMMNGGDFQTFLACNRIQFSGPQTSHIML